MNPPRRTIFSATLVSIFAAVALGSASGQAVKVTGQSPTFDDLPSPQFAGVKNKRFSPLDWLEIEVPLKVELSPEPPSKTCEKMTIKWYVAVKNIDKAGTLLLFTKEVEHVNVPLNEEIYGSVFISPASLRRITGSGTGGKNSVELVGYEILVNGEVKAKGSNKTVKGKVDWWNITSDSISRSEVVPLLNKNETPFSAMWWDRYPEISVERR
ncbi:MAG: Amuc_1102 family pilus-like protein [Luteolibacter sp.]